MNKCQNYGYTLNLDIGHHNDPLSIYKTDTRWLAIMHLNFTKWLCPKSKVKPSLNAPLQLAHALLCAYAFNSSALCCSCLSNSYSKWQRFYFLWLRNHTDVIIMWPNTLQLFSSFFLQHTFLLHFKNVFWTTSTCFSQSYFRTMQHHLISYFKRGKQLRLSA